MKKLVNLAKNINWNVIYGKDNVNSATDILVSEIKKIIDAATYIKKSKNIPKTPRIS